MIYQAALIFLCLSSCRNVMHNLLEKVDSYLWAKKPNTLMPEVSKQLSKHIENDHLLATNELICN